MWVDRSYRLLNFDIENVVLASEEYVIFSRAVRYPCGETEKIWNDVFQHWEISL